MVGVKLETNPPLSLLSFLKNVSGPHAWNELRRRGVSECDAFILDPPLQLGLNQLQQLQSACGVNYEQGFVFTRTDFRGDKRNVLFC